MQQRAKREDAKQKEHTGEEARNVKRQTGTQSIIVKCVAQVASPAKRFLAACNRGSRLALRHCSNLATVINDLGRMRRCLSCQDSRNFGVSLSLRFLSIVVLELGTPAESCVVQAEMGLRHCGYCACMCVLIGMRERPAGAEPRKASRVWGLTSNGENDQRHIICAEFAKIGPMTLFRLDLLQCRPHGTGNKTTSYLLIREKSIGNVS